MPEKERKDLRRKLVPVKNAQEQRPRFVPDKEQRELRHSSVPDKGAQKGAAPLCAGRARAAVLLRAGQDQKITLKEETKRGIHRRSPRGGQPPEV
jgi:hypothetical protein